MPSLLCSISSIRWFLLVDLSTIPDPETMPGWIGSRADRPIGWNCGKHRSPDWAWRKNLPSNESRRFSRKRNLEKNEPLMHRADHWGKQPRRQELFQIETACLISVDLAKKPPTLLRFSQRWVAFVRKMQNRQIFGRKERNKRERKPLIPVDISNKRPFHLKSIIFRFLGRIRKTDLSEHFFDRR